MRRQSRTILGLMLPFFSLVLNLSMFTVAVPAIRDDFGLLADSASWVVMGFTIPYVLFMPLHGRLGDLLGTRNLLAGGMLLYGLGTVVCMLAPGMGAIVAGRLVQAAGAASVNPLSLSIISRDFDPDSQGRALGTWNAAGPMTGIIGPAIGGVLVDTFGWRSIYVPMIVVIGVAFFMLFVLVPADRKPRVEKKAIAELDWTGMGLTALALTSVVLYLSSRPITGRDPFTDWRLFLLFAFSAVAWVVWERRQAVPFVSISLFAKRQFAVAAICVGTRMALLGAISFLVPLYAADVLGIPPSQTGIMITLHSVALLITMRFGGRLADVWNRKLAVLIGLSGQSLTLLWIALVAATSQIGLIVPLMLHGGFAGISLASLHRVAMREIPMESAGVGAGTYSMSRFIGSLLGAAVMGIVLEHGLATADTVQAAYQQSFLVAGCIGIAGSIPAVRIHGAT